MLVLQPDTVIAGRFRLVRELGRGGMGAVWVARHTSLGIDCAVKFILGEAATRPELIMRFEREARAAAVLKSPNVVQILDHGVYEGTPYIAMELLEGEDLAARLARQGRLSPKQTVAVVNQIARALSKAHAAGVVHRDLKPENVFLVRDDDEEIVKVLDFGIAKSAKDAVPGPETKSAALLGTPYYMSPEQAKASKRVDHRSDLWSLAVVTFRCLTGQLPFDGESLFQLMSRIVDGPLPRPSEVAPDLPLDFDAWWLRAAARDPAARFQSARELAGALSGAFGMTPVSGVEAFSAPPPAAASKGAASAPGALPEASSTAAPVMSTLSGRISGARMTLFAGALGVLGLGAIALMVWLGRHPAAPAEASSEGSTATSAPNAAPPDSAPDRAPPPPAVDSAGAGETAAPATYRAGRTARPATRPGSSARPGASAPGALPGSSALGF